jgi:hypothetical protein
MSQHEILIGAALKTLGRAAWRVSRPKYCLSRKRGLGEDSHASRATADQKLSSRLATRAGEASVAAVFASRAAAAA